MSNDMYDVVIVGGGTAGLSALSSLRSTKNLLLEAAPKLGGRVESIKYGNVTAELGAFYPINMPSNKSRIDKNTDEPIKTLLFIQSKTDATEYRNFKHAFKSLRDNQTNSSSDLFYQQFLINSSQLNLKISNPRYGDLSLLSHQQLKLVEALHQITHPGKITDFPCSLRPLCLVSEPYITRKMSNISALLHSFPVPLDSEINLNSKVININEISDCVVVKYKSGSQVRTVKSKAVILTPPPATCFDTLEKIKEESLRFYQASPYIGGWSVVFYFKGQVPIHSIFLSTNYDWSVCFLTKVDDNHYLVNCYVPSSRMIYGHYKHIIKDIYTTVSNYLPGDATLLNSHSKYWRYLAPNISQLTIDYYTPSHSRLGDKVFYAGELSTFTLRNMYTYGVSNAIRAGNLAAQAVLKELKHENIGINQSSFPPLLTAYMYKFDHERPKYIGSQQEGNVAFYGLVLSASGSNKLKDYLVKNSLNGMWEYHKGFGVTLEDTLLVLEGLNDYGLSKKILQYHLDQCINHFYDKKTRLFKTLNTGRDRYWEGSSIHGTAHAYYLIYKYYSNFHTLTTVSALVDYVADEFTSNYIWNSKWFCNSYFTSFHVIRLLCLFPSNKIACNLIVAHTEQILQSQLCDGSWDHMLISTSSIVLTLSLIVSNRLLASQTQIEQSIKKACGFLQSSLAQKEQLNEPILYYWYNTSISETKQSKRFYHCVDNGQISHSLIVIALRNADKVLNYNQL